MTDREMPNMEMYLVTPESPYINALFYSEPGDGKTTLAASAQDHKAMKHVLFANIEGGMISIAWRQDIHSIDINSIDDLYDLFWMFSNGDPKVRNVHTLVIDNVSELQRVNLDQIVADEIEKSERDKGERGKKREDPDEIYQEDYGRSTNQLERVFRWFKNWPINVIFTAHAKYVYPKVGRNVDTTDLEPTVVLPKLTQMLCKTLMGLVDFVWFLEYDPEEDVRYLITQPNGIVRAKTRGPRFAKAIGSIRQIGDDTMHDGRRIGRFYLPEIYQLLVDTESGRAPLVSRKVKKKRTR
jgi:hypothetical protein